MQMKNVLKKIGAWLEARLQTLARIFRRFQADNGMTLAGSLSFYFLISILPMSLLALSLLGHILGSRSAAVSAVTALGKIGNILPEGTIEIESILGDLIGGKGMLGGVGILLLVLFSGGVFYTIELIINQIFRVSIRRGFLRRTAVVYFFILIAGILLLASIAATVIAVIVGDLSMSIFGINPAEIPLLWNLFFSLVPPALIMLMFAIIYKVGPKTKVAWRAAFGGAVFGSVLWEISRRLFGLYLSSIAPYSKLYGALGVFLALWIWIFYSANIFIIGAEYAAILDERRNRRISVEKNLERKG